MRRFGSLLFKKSRFLPLLENHSVEAPVCAPLHEISARDVPARTLDFNLRRVVIHHGSPGRLFSTASVEYGHWEANSIDWDSNPCLRARILLKARKYGNRVDVLEA